MAEYFRPLGVRLDDDGDIVLNPAPDALPYQFRYWVAGPSVLEDNEDGETCTFLRNLDDCTHELVRRVMADVKYMHHEYDQILFVGEYGTTVRIAEDELVVSRHASESLAAIAWVEG